MTSRPLSYQKIFVFWLPLASTWFMMSVEGPFLAALVARSADPMVNLAAFGVAFAFAIIIESPVIMLMSASTALVKDAHSFVALRNFSRWLSGFVTLVQLFVVQPFVFNAIARFMDLPPDVSELTHGGLVILLPWPAAIAYRRFRQGLLIRHNQTNRVAYGTMIRLVAMSVTAFMAFGLFRLPGAYVGALALSVAVISEALASRVMTQAIVADFVALPHSFERGEVHRLPEIIRFYWPLALTSFVALSIQPMVTFFMGQARFPLESLAVLPVIHGLTFIFRAIGLSYLEVVIALLGPRREHFRRLLIFAGWLAVVSTTGLAVMTFTQMTDVWFRQISGLSLSMTLFALPAARILTIFPVLSVALHLLRAVLVHAHRPRSITSATVLEVILVGIVLMVTVHVLDFVGAVAASVAILIGRVFGVAWLVLPCLEVLQSQSSDDVAPTKVD